MEYFDKLWTNSEFINVNLLENSGDSIRNICIIIAEVEKDLKKKEC